MLHKPYFKPLKMNSTKITKWEETNSESISIVLRCIEEKYLTLYQKY